MRIEIPKLLVHLRGKAVESRGRLDPEGVAMRTLYRTFRSRSAYERAQRVGRVAGRPLARGGRIRRLPGPLAGWTSVRDMPPVADQTFREWWREREGVVPPSPPVPASPAARRKPARVAKAPAFGNARTDVLARVREAIAGAAAVEVPHDYRRRDDASHPEFVDRFEQRAGDYNATVQRVAAGDVGAAVAAICRRQDVARLGVAAGLPSEWLPGGLGPVHDDALSTAELDALDGALTGCALAIAETGTIVLDGGPGQGRRALTLVPDLHVCVVEARSVVGLVPEAIDRLAPAVREGRPLTFVSGPSATSDIELRRVEGVHGPRRLEILIVA